MSEIKPSESRSDRDDPVESDQRWMRLNTGWDTLGVLREYPSSHVPAADIKLPGARDSDLDSEAALKRLNDLYGSVERGLPMWRNWGKTEDDIED